MKNKEHDHIKESKEEAPFFGLPNGIHDINYPQKFVYSDQKKSPVIVKKQSDDYYK